MATKKKPQPRRKEFDWESIKREYRVGQLSVRMIAKQHGCSDMAIHKRARKENWQRDLSSRVQGGIRAKLVCSEVCAEVCTPNARERDANQGLGDSDSAEEDEAVVRAAVDRGVQVVQSHRKDIAQARLLIQALFSQLAVAAQCRVEIEAAIMETGGEGGNAQRVNKMLQAVSLPSHARVARDLATALKTVVLLERQAFNLDAKDDSQAGLHTVILKNYMGRERAPSSHSAKGMR